MKTNRIDAEKIKMFDLPPNTRLKVIHCNDPDELRTYALFHKNGVTYPKYATVAVLISEDGSNPTAVGYSLCGPNDEPSRKVGYRIARNRAIRTYHRQVTGNKEGVTP